VATTDESKTGELNDGNYYPCILYVFKVVQIFAISPEGAFFYNSIMYGEKAVLGISLGFFFPL
jgi:hypothetical protein